MNTSIKLILLIVSLLLIVSSIFYVSPLKLAVGSGESMEPTFDSNSTNLLVQTQVDTINDVEEGDIITYYDAEFDKFITHRIVSIDPTTRTVVIAGDNQKKSISQTLTFSQFNNTKKLKVEHIYSLKIV